MGGSKVDFGNGRGVEAGRRQCEQAGEGRHAGWLGERQGGWVPAMGENMVPASRCCSGRGETSQGSGGNLEASTYYACAAGGDYGYEQDQYGQQNYDEEELRRGYQM